MLGNNDEWRFVHLPNIPLLNCKLSPHAIKRLWKYIENAKQNKVRHNKNLVGNISESLLLEDTDNYFFNNHLKRPCEDYLASNRISSSRNPFHNREYPVNLYMPEFWVNFSKKHEFNPPHTHTGVLSFVVWMAIPTEHRDQYKLPHCVDSGSPAASDFAFSYTAISGEIMHFSIPMGKESEGMMYVFPSTLYHQVHPFYECDEERVSISGNLFLEEP